MKMNRYLALAKKIQEVHQEIMAIAAEEHDILGFDNTFDRMEEYLTKLHTIYGSDASPVPLLAHPTQPAQPAKAGETDQKRIERILTTGSAKECLTEALYWQAYYIGEDDCDLETLGTSQALIERAISLL